MSPELRLSTLGQIAMNVKDLARATTFYRDSLRVPFLFEAPSLAFFDLGGVRLMLSPPEGPDHAASVLYFKVDDIAAARAALVGRGVAFVDEPHVIADMGTYTLWMTFFHDSEGNLLALMSEVAKAGS